MQPRASASSDRLNSANIQPIIIRELWDISCITLMISILIMRVFLNIHTMHTKMGLVCVPSGVAFEMEKLSKL